MKRLELTFFVYCFRELIFFRKIFDYHISWDYSTWQDNKREENIKISSSFNIKVSFSGRYEHTLKQIKYAKRLIEALNSLRLLESI